MTNFEKIYIFKKKKAMENKTKKNLSIENGFQVVMLFLQSFWLDFFKKKLLSEKLIHEGFEPEIFEDAPEEEKQKNALHYRNWYFFAVVCDGTSSDYFEKVIEKRLHLPPIKQSGIEVSEEVLFQLMIDFCEFANDRFSVTMKDSLRFAINWLEDMRRSPNDHKTEWNLWRFTIFDVIENGARSAGFF